MYTMHNHEEAPGYGFQLKFGATTLTEQWDPRQGSSWNHFMMGQIDEWFFNSLAGIRTVEGKPGMKEIEIRPRPVGDLTYVRASTQTLYGKVAVDWTRENGVFTLKVTIPVGCTARVFLPDEKEPKIVESGTYSFKKINAVFIGKSPLRVFGKTKIKIMNDMNKRTFLSLLLCVCCLSFSACGACGYAAGRCRCARQEN